MHECLTCGREFGSPAALAGHTGGAHAAQPRKRLACDGTAEDYRRHKKRGEDACAASKKSWREKYRNVRGARL